MRIAIMGIRGIPANYGGFETFAERLSIGLVKKGHDVTVYGRSNIIDYPEKEYHGVKLVILPTISHKYFDTLAHTFLCVLHAVFQRYDAILICNAANSIFSWIPRLFGSKVVLNVDGLERKRKKWNRIAKSYYLLSEWLSTWMPTCIVTDAAVIQDYYSQRYRKESTMIAYGADVVREPEPEKVRELGLEPERYVLCVSRLEPENNVHKLIEAFEQTKTELNLAVVGDAPYAPDYIRKLKETKDPRIKFLGYVFGSGYKALQQNSFCFVQATEVGGTHPALIEAMGYGNCVLVNGTPENLEVVQDCAIPFRTTDELRDALQRVLDDPGILAEYRKRAMARIQTHYSWERIVDQYEALFERLLKKERSTASPVLVDENECTR
ncbi:MAG TPA: DUF1972 domain-containing protein [Chroococcales cyanobacterium]|jgi:glycosyltransferase involved in cell wall biosynthesis